MLQDVIKHEKIYNYLMYKSKNFSIFTVYLNNENNNKQ